MGKTYFAVTTFHGEHRDRFRTVGCFYNEELARQCVKENLGDIYECGWYPYAVIEELEWGLYPNSIGRQQFYHWNRNQQKYVSCVCPTIYKQLGVFLC